jgi:hypothetical protein
MKPKVRARAMSRRKMLALMSEAKDWRPMAGLSKSISTSKRVPS